MKRSVRGIVFKLAAITALFACYYPAIMVIRAAAFKESGGPGWAFFYFLTAFAGYGAGFFLAREESAWINRWTANRAVDFLLFLIKKDGSAEFLEKVLAHLTLLIPAGLIPLIYSGTGILRMAFEGFAGVFLYFLGLRSHFTGVFEIVSRKKAVVGVIALSASLFTAYSFSQFGYLKPYIFMLGYIFMLLYMVLKNQESLNFNLFARKGADASNIPSKLRKYNILAAFALSVATVLIFFSRNVVLFMMGIAGEIVKAVIRFALWLLSLMGSSETPGPRQEEPAPLTPGFFGDESAVNPFGNFIFNIFKNFILLYACYKGIPLIYKGLRRLAAFLVRLFHRLLQGTGDAALPEDREYDDEVEVIKPDTGFKAVRPRVRIRSAKKALDSIVDPVEKIRFIYCSIIKVLLGMAVNIRKADTTGEIHSKALALKALDPCFGRLTEAYDEVRYGDIVPDPDRVRRAEDDYINLLMQLRDGIKFN